MSTRKPRGRPAQTINRLSDEDTKRLDTFMLDIAGELLPLSTPVRATGGETCFGSKGSLKLDASGRWYHHEAGTGGRGGLSLAAHLLPTGPKSAALVWAQKW